QDHDVRTPDEERVVGEGVETVGPGQLLQPLLPDVGDEQLLGRDDPRLDDAADQRLAHVAAAEEADLLALDGHAVTALQGGRPRETQKSRCRPERWWRLPRPPPRSLRSCPWRAPAGRDRAPTRLPCRGASGAPGSAGATPRGPWVGAEWS